MKQPDLFDRIAEEAMRQSADSRFLAAAEVAALLRKEDQRVKRIIRGEKWCYIGSHYQCGYNNALDTILDKLNERAS